MAEEYEVVVKVISQTGYCARGHKVGDEWIIADRKLPDVMCFNAFASVLGYIQVLRYGGTFAWSTFDGITDLACPDGKNPVLFELRRGKKLG